MFICNFPNGSFKHVHLGVTSWLLDSAHLREAQNIIGSLVQIPQEASEKASRVPEYFTSHTHYFLLNAIFQKSLRDRVQKNYYRFPFFLIMPTNLIKNTFLIKARCKLLIDGEMEHSY